MTRQMSRMKTLSHTITLLIIVAVLRPTAASAGPTDYTVMPGSKDNSIMLEVQNRLGENLPRLEARVEKHPPWIDFTGGRTNTVALAPDSTAEIELLFDVGRSLPAGTRGEVEIVLANGSREVLRKTIALVGAAPDHFELSQNYPNPFNPSTTISYQVPRASRVSITVYDLIGREVKSLVDEVRDAGSYEVPFDAGGLATGMYIYRMQATGASSYHEVKKMLLMK